MKSKSSKYTEFKTKYKDLCSAHKKYWLDTYILIQYAFTINSDLECPYFNTSKNDKSAWLDIRHGSYSNKIFSSVQNNTIFKIPNKVYKIRIKSSEKGENSLKYIFKAIFYFAFLVGLKI